MTKVRSISDIAALYESVRSPKQEVIEEKAQKFPKDTFPQSTKEVKPSSDFESSGPNAALNIKGGKKKVKKKKSAKKPGKVVEDSINSFMKSEFDKLFENVMGDDESSFDVSPSMGPEGGEAGEADVDLGGEEGGADEVTLTISKDLAQQLHDVLMGVLGDAEGAGEESELEDLGIDMESEEGDEMGGSDEENLNDATEMSELSDSQGQKLMSKGSMKAPGNVTNKSGSKASHTTATDKQGNETKGHPMDLNAGAGGKDQKVNGQSVTNKVGKPFFQ